MTIDYNAYFSSGELAKLVGISKQMLRYYEKNNILIPDIIDQNSYRYYKPEIYFSLEIILSLRKLNIPLKTIKEFLTHRNITMLRSFYLEQIENLEKIKRQVETYQNIFHEKIFRLDEITNFPINTVMLMPSHDHDIILSDKVAINTTHKKRLESLAKFLRPLLDKQEYTDYTIGYLESREHFLKAESDPYFRAFFPARGLAEKNLGSLQHCSGGIYLSIIFKDKYGSIPKETNLIIKDFIEKNRLKLLSDIYVYVIGDFWSSQTGEENLARLFVRVEYEV